MAFAAKFAGVCEACEDPIRPGDSVVYIGDDLVHAGCAVTTTLGAKKPREVCSICFLEKPCPCEDGL